MIELFDTVLHRILIAKIVNRGNFAYLSTPCCILDQLDFLQFLSIIFHEDTGLKLIVEDIDGVERK